MNSTLAGHLIERWLPTLLAAAVFSALALWVGILFSVSWLSGRARWCADGAEMGRHAQALSDRWATPLLFVALVAAVGWVAVLPSIAPTGNWLAGVAAAVAALIVVHSSVALRARRVARGSVSATRGEAGRRLVIVLSMSMLAALVSLHLLGP